MFNVWVGTMAASVKFGDHAFGTDMISGAGKTCGAELYGTTVLECESESLEEYDGTTESFLGMAG